MARSTPNTNEVMNSAECQRGDSYRAVLKAENVGVTVPLKTWWGRTVGQKEILGGVSLTLRSGETMAVMGPSGAGKTTLMEALTMESNGGRRTGTIKLNGRVMSQDLFQKHCAYVPQHDSGWPFLSSRESLQFTADFHIDEPRAERVKRVDDLLATLGLEECQHTRIGNELIKGLSGGQKRRLSLAAAILKDPEVIFLDEVTTGLDAAAAAGIARALQSLAREKDTIILCTIHQPSAKVFFGFQRLLLLSGGRVAFVGNVSEVAGYFDTIGYPTPRRENPADFYLEIVNSDFATKEAVDAVLGMWASQGQRDESRPLQARVLKEKLGPSNTSRSLTLLRRMSLVAFRDPLVYLSRLVVFVLADVFFALVYFKSRERTQEQVFNRMWLIMWHIGVPAMMSVAGALGQNQEFVAVRREVKAHTYRLSSYFAAQVVIQVPLIFLLSASAIGISGYGLGNWKPSAFLGSLLMHGLFLLSFESAAQFFAVTFSHPLLPLFGVVGLWFTSLLFAGFMVPEADIAWPMRIFTYISPIKWATKALIYEEFAGTVYEGAVEDPTSPRGFSCPHGASLVCYGRTGEQVLRSAAGVAWAHVKDVSEYWQDASIVLGIALAFRVAFFLMAALKCGAVTPAVLALRRAAGNARRVEPQDFEEEFVGVAQAPRSSQRSDQGEASPTAGLRSRAPPNSAEPPPTLIGAAAAASSSASSAQPSSWPKPLPTSPAAAAAAAASAAAAAAAAVTSASTAAAAQQQGKGLGRGSAYHPMLTDEDTSDGKDSAGSGDAAASQHEKGQGPSRGSDHHPMLIDEAVPPQPRWWLCC